MLNLIFNDRTFVTWTCPCLWWIFSIVVVVLEQVVDMKAPYGRYNAENKGIPVRIAWFLQELPSFVVPTYLLYVHSDNLTWTKSIIVGFYLIHYTQRVFVFPFLIRGGKASSVLTTILAFIFCSLNSNMIAKETILYHDFDKNYLSSARFFLGAAIFFLGFYLNLQSDSILRNLRKNDEDKTYKIPRGGLFEYVSGANFLSECIEWTGYAICASTTSAWAFSAFTWANIGFGRAIHHHKFYLEKFKDYPKNRKAIIPFVF